MATIRRIARFARKHPHLISDVSYIGIWIGIPLGVTLIWCFCIGGL